MLTLLLMFACVPKGPSDWSSFYASPPQLPSPHAGAYARVKTKPSDPVIRSVVADWPWEASLSGAAAGIALDLVSERAVMQPWAIRHAAWQAGYPYPVVQVQGWTVELGATPPPQLAPWVSGNVRPGDDLGLVRARDPEGDIWMALVGRPVVDLGPLPKEVPVGGAVALPPVPGGSYSWATATGRLYEGKLDEGARLATESIGEHLLEVEIDGKLVALVPIYVGMSAPSEALFDSATSPREPADAARVAADLLIGVRQAYAVGAWQREPLLDSAAAKVENDADAERLAKAVGFLEGERWQCRAQSIEDCIDRLVFDPTLRPVLLDDRWSSFGISAALDGQVELTILLGAES